MRHHVDTFKVGRSGSHRRAMLANMASSLFINGRINTTLVKGKELRRFADSLITLGKKGTLHHRRLAVARLRDKDAVKKLFEKIAKEFATRAGGYTRVLKTGFRQGDAAEMCIVELVQAEAPKAAKKTEKAEKAVEVKAEEAK